MFYAIFILMYIISSSNCIRIIGLPDNSEPDFYTLSRMQQYVYNIALSRPNDESDLHIRYYMYVLRANPALFNIHEISHAMWNYEYIRSNVMNNVNINNDRLLTYNQWLEVLYIYSNEEFYGSDMFAQGLNRIPLKPHSDGTRVYVNLCRNLLQRFASLYVSAINSYFAQHILPPEEETQASLDARLLRDEVIGYLGNMMRCYGDIAWLRRMYNNDILSCESYLSYALRTIRNGKIPIPKASIPSIYDVPPDFNPFINITTFNIRVVGLSEDDRDACVFMFALVNRRD